MTLGKLKGSLAKLRYRLKIRNNLQQADTDTLLITYEEAKKEIERRNKKK